MTDHPISMAPIPFGLEDICTLHTPVHADVKFGVLQPDGDCLNIGICRIVTAAYPAPARPARNRACPTAPAQLYSLPDGRLLMHFPKSGMLPCTERAFFRQPVFPMPVPFYLPDAVRRLLPGLKMDVLPSGLYPIHRSNTGYWIVF